MPEKLPVYRILDFTAARALSHGFHVVDLQTHLQKHAFVQAPHKHDSYLLLHIQSGSGSHTIDFTTYEVKPNCVFFLTPGQVHAWQLTDDTQGTLLFFTPEFYQSGMSPEDLRSYPFFRAWQYPPVLYTTAPALVPVQRLITAILQEYATAQPLQSNALRAYLHLLLIQLTRLYPVAPALPGSSSWPFQLYLLETLVEEHYRQHRPVSFYANELHLSAKHLNDLCRQNLGKSTTHLLQERLVLEAKRLLIHSPHLNIAQIAQILGFEDNSYFSRFFKKEVGLTPEQFRRQG
jgi:AraC family transcriptional regulator, transcriptional activator of pobA